MKYLATGKTRRGFYTLMHAISTQEFYWGDIATTMLNVINTRVSKDTRRLQMLGCFDAKAFGFSYGFLQEYNSDGVGELPKGR